MRKVFLLVLICVSVQFTANAQIFLMPKFGVNFTDVNFSDAIKSESDVEFKSRTGWMGGVAVNFGVSDLFSIQPEFMYIQKGLKFGGSSQDPEYDVRIDYFEIPVLAKFSVGDENKRGYFNLGPQVSFGLGGKVKATLNGQEQSAKVKFGDEPEDNEEDLYFDNSIDFGIQAGGGFGFKVGPGHLVIDFRYSLGLGNLFETPDGADKADLRSKNRMFATNLGYTIPLGR